jgi:hypothetical protein
MDIMTRNEFLKSSVMLAAAAGSGASLAAGGPPKGGKTARNPAAPRNRHPYSGLDWQKAVQINTTSHGHCINQTFLDAYIKHRFGLMTISNYYPSAPTVPGKDFRSGHYRVHHDWPVMYKGKRTEGPFDWNRIIKPWAGTLEEKYRRQYPFKEGAKMFPNWPDDMLEAPNAEHHSFVDDNGSSTGALHMCAPGSAYKSGTFDARDFFGTHSRGYHYGSGEHWRTAIDRMIEGLIYEDGGGVTINHPTWTHLDREFLLKLLDHDPRVLGIEVLEAGTNSENYWDWVLSTGRQCFGVFVPDWSIGNEVFGVNVLVVPERTVHACLKAYRQGNFYGAERGYGELAFTRIAFDGNELTVETDKPARFEVKTARGIRMEAKGREVKWRKCTEEKPRKQDWGTDIFVRVKAYALDSKEVLYTQPIML